MEKKKIERTVLILLVIALVIAVIASAVLVFYAKEMLNEVEKLQAAIESDRKGTFTSIVSGNSFYVDAEATMISAY